MELLLKTTQMAYNNGNVFSRRSGVWKSKVKLSAGPYSFCRL